MGKLSNEEKEYRDKLSLFIRKYIFYYSDSEPTPAFFWKRINGLRRGEFLITGDLYNKENYYTYKDILYVFIKCKKDIDRCTSLMEFHDENHKINTILKIVISNMIPVLREKKNKEEKDKKLSEINVEDRVKIKSSKDYYTQKEGKDVEDLEEFF